MFRKLLIANRGEIACRIARTARRLGVGMVAIYSEADADALHVALADEAWPIGPPHARDSYLAIDRILDVARRSGAEAVHPGYGFLAENAEFAESCRRAGLTFIGPSPQAMRLMGSKAQAKMLMERAGVPIVPGYHANDPDDATLAAAAAHIGFPALVKASAGGGGRGMRIVRDAAEFADAAAAARREALAAFGDGRLLIERYLERPRHIEIQIFADPYGGAVGFHERDCSMQRHHQKILEETPAPGLTPELRRAMSEAAIAAARSVDYVGAGTVEFLVQDDAFYFLEMNTRLQVEHPVTEMISGLDLVEWQLRVAGGEKLSLTQESLDMRGCAVEARVCAEDPVRDFLPSAGIIEHFRPPSEVEGVRVDAGFRCGDRITPYYDSLIAKLVVWGADRPTALNKLQRALHDFEIFGPTTNLDFMRALALHPDFVKGEYDTTFVERQANSLLSTAERLDEVALLAVGAAARVRELRLLDQRRAAEADDAFSPWAAADGWRIHDRGSHDIRFKHDGADLSARATPLSNNAFRLETPSASIVVEAEFGDDRMRVRIDGVERKVGIVSRGNGFVIISAGRNHILEMVDPLRPPTQGAGADALLSAPIPARVTRVLVRAGDKVEKGQPLVALEAMKMEFTVSAPRNGVIERVLCVEGEMAQENAQLIALTEDDAQ